jgi:predicted metal-dependent hydrolase
VPWFPKQGEESRVIELGGQRIPYLLKRSARRRTIALRIDHKGLTVSVPLRTAVGRFEAVLREKAGWVLEKLPEQRSCHAPPRTWQEGEVLPYLGSELRLALQEGGARAQPRVHGEILLVPVEDPQDPLLVQSKVVKWYRREALAHFTGRVAHYAAQLEVARPPLRLSNAATRWGSCNSRGEVRLNWRLIKAPHELIDYVVAHELAHLKHLNHSPAFWMTVGRLYPAYDAARVALRKNGHRYHTF